MNNRPKPQGYSLNFVGDTWKITVDGQTFRIGPRFSEMPKEDRAVSKAFMRKMIIMAFNKLGSNDQT